MISIRVNDQSYNFDQPISLKALLESLKIKVQGVAVAVNQEVIQKTVWEDTSLNDQDSILIIQATQGG